MQIQIAENEQVKAVKSDKYNYLFNKKTGFFARWGETKEDDPICAPAPEIADIEISTICHGVGKNLDVRTPCSWCYKSNTGEGQNMSLETFQEIFHKFPRTLTQIAFGIGDIDSNPDLWDIMEYCRDNPYNSVVPNITVNGMGVNEEAASKLAGVCGAIAVSRYIPDLCYDTVHLLTSAMSEEGTLRQVNIHQLLSEETLASCYQLLDDIKNDPRLENLNAVVFLMLKPKGQRNKFHAVESAEKFEALFAKAIEMGIQVGMDSCTAPLTFRAALSMNQEGMFQSIEPCESGLFSIYVSVDAKVYPCSFTEGVGDWEEGLDLLSCEDFDKDIWSHPKFVEWKKQLVGSTSGCQSCAAQKHCRSCPAFDITPCREAV